MKLTAINIHNFLGAGHVEVQLTTPVTLFAGKNGAGKSSAQEAIRMALTGEAVRVGLKKDYGQLVFEGEKTGFAEVEIDGAVRAFVTLPDGKTTPPTDYMPPKALPYVLDAQRFARLEPTERRAFLFGLMGLSAGGVEVKKRLLANGCDGEKVEAILPMLRSGFDAAHKEAKERAREEKAAWRAITGETYSDVKAATWQAEKPAFDAAALADLQQRLATADTKIAEANQHIGQLKSDRQHHIEAAQRLAQMRERGKNHARIADKLARDETELKEWEAKVAALKNSATSQNALPCPACGAMLVLNGGELVHAAPLAHGTDDDLARLPEYEKAMRLLQSAVANGQRDLAAAQAAAKTIAELESAVVNGPDEAELHLALNDSIKSLNDLKAERSDIAAQLEAQLGAERKAKRADECTLNALTAHKSVLKWGAIADALAPDGIPGEMLAEALGPINNRLEQSSQDAQWMQVHIEQDMSIWAAYPEPEQRPRPYALLSESEQWRADAMLAEAIAHLSKIGVLVLDGFDVLDLQGRDDLIAWLDVLAGNGEINTALIFGTLKALPATLPPTIAAHWIENGAVAKLEAR